MRAITSFLATVVISLACGVISFGQEVKDYYKFDDNGLLCEFLQTTPDGVKITYDGAKEIGLIIYPDGTQIDYSKALATSYDGPRIYPDTRKYDINGALPLKDWYKDLRKAESAPRGVEMMDGVFGIHELTIVFPDNSQANILFTSGGPRVEEYLDAGEGGDLVRFDRYYVKSINMHNPKILNPETNEVLKDGVLVSGVVTRSETKLEGTIVTADGETFTGLFGIKYNVEDRRYGGGYNKDAVRNYNPKSKYLNSLSGDSKKDFSIWPQYGIDNILGVYPEKGTVVNKENKIVAMYENAKQLDEFDMASEMAAEQGKIDRAIAQAKKAASQKESITAKYGKKYADAFFAGKVIVGMPWSLVSIGLEAHSFNDFYTALLSIDRTSSYGSRKCYSLYGDNLAYVGHIWVVNGAVESITLY